MRLLLNINIRQFLTPFGNLLMSLSAWGKLLSWDMYEDTSKNVMELKNTLLHLRAFRISAAIGAAQGAEVEEN
jgi:hypothetical protein